jgi:hypothetical protein
MGTNLDGPATKLHPRERSGAVHWEPHIRAGELRVLPMTTGGWFVFDGRRPNAQCRVSDVFGELEAAEAECKRLAELEAVCETAARAFLKAHP